MQPVRHVSVTEAEAGQKLLQFLERRLGGRVPRSLIQRWVRKGEVRVDKGRAKPFDRLAAGQVVRIPPYRDPGGSSEEGACATGSADASGIPKGQAVDAAEPELCPLGLRVVHEDADVLVLSKPAGLPAQGGTGHTDSIAARLRASYPDAPFLPTIAHRLDRDTSGLLAAGKSYAGLRRLQRALAEKGDGSVLRRADAARDGEGSGGALKIYLVWVEGRWESSGVLRLEDRLEKGGAPGTERMLAGSGKLALAEVAPLRVEAERSLLAVRLVTGRTHQIRAQLAERGYPVAGDRKYGGRLPIMLKLHAFVLDVAGLRLSDPPHWDGCWAAADVSPECVRSIFSV